MKSIEELSNAIENEIDMAENYAKQAIQYKMDDPEISKGYLAASSTHIDIALNNLHGIVVNKIAAYRKTEGEPPAPMMTLYNYLHKRFMEKVAAIKILQDLSR